jgi:hypothetical protein
VDEPSNEPLSEELLRQRKLDEARALATLPRLLDSVTFAQIAAAIQEGFKAGVVFHGQEITYLLHHPGLITKVQIAFNALSEEVLDILLTTDVETIYLTWTKPDNMACLRERESSISRQNGRNLTHMDMVRSVTNATLELFRLQRDPHVEGVLLSVQQRLDLIHENDITTRGCVQHFFSTYYVDPTQYGAEFFTVNTLDRGKIKLPLSKDGMQFLPDFLDKQGVAKIAVI